MHEVYGTSKEQADRKNTCINQIAPLSFVGVFFKYARMSRDFEAAAADFDGVVFFREDLEVLAERSRESAVDADADLSLALAWTV